MLKAIASLDLLIIDDWGLEPLNTATRNDLLEITDDRSQQSANILLSLRVFSIVLMS
ncbi:MAG: ATP-binding protein [Methylovulum sp.]|nr:ATP-binding protein [Methylovulum sp.]MCF8000092.1 ATP-binding protein [Methylovulum sp.]